MQLPRVHRPICSRLKAREEKPSNRSWMSRLQRSKRRSHPRRRSISTTLCRPKCRWWSRATRTGRLLSTCSTNCWRLASSTRMKMAASSCPASMARRSSSPFRVNDESFQKRWLSTSPFCLNHPSFVLIISLSLNGTIRTILINRVINLNLFTM